LKQSENRPISFYSVSFRLSMKKGEIWILPVAPKLVGCKQEPETGIRAQSGLDALILLVIRTIRDDNQPNTCS
jgi:hypothetical protein